MMMELTFSPSADVAVVLNTLLDILERRKNQSERCVRVSIVAINLPTYFSQIDPTPRVTANEQCQILEKAGILNLTWFPGETGHLLQSVTLKTEHATRIYQLIHRSAKQDQLTRLQTLLLAEKFRFVDDWRARALRHILGNLRAGKSPAPFSLTDTGLDTDLLAVMEALPSLQTETPYRAFSVRVFNDSKRLETIKNQLVSLARLGNPEWKRLPVEEVLRELNLVPNPTYLHLAGNWQLTLQTGEILTLGGFAPSVGFPAAQTAQLQSVQIHAACNDHGRNDAVLCIENLTTFHEFVRTQHATRNLALSTVEGTQYATICTLGNPSPALRRLVRPDIQPYRMDIATLDANYPRSCPLAIADKANLKKLLLRPELRDLRPIIEHLLKRGVKLEQEGVE